MTIQVFSSEHGGHDRISSAPVGANTSRGTADTSWKKGEVLDVDAAAGDVNVHADGAIAIDANILLAGSSSEGEIVKAAGLTGTTGDADGRPAPGVAFTPGMEVASRNVFNNNDVNIGPDGSGAMTGVLIGVTCALWRDDTNPGPVSGNVNGDFGFDINGSGLVITRILDSEGRDTAVTGGTPDRVVARVV